MKIYTLYFKRKACTALLVFLSIFKSYSQYEIGFQEHIIIEDINSLYTSDDIEVADIDGDGDIDIFANGRQEDKLVWFENIDGQGTYSDERVISNQENQVNLLLAKDVDGDNDIDIIYATDDDIIFWYENEDGAGNFGQFRIFIAGGLANLRSFDAGDIDLDGDLDVIASYANDNRIEWFRNNNGNGTNWSDIIVRLDADDTRKLHLTDIDLDGDLDLIAAQRQTESLVWYRNDIVQDGTLFDLPEITIDNSAEPFAISSEDLDNDGDIDIVSSPLSESELVWHENLDGQGTYAPPIIINNNLGVPSEIIIKDIDQDNDMDIAVSSYFNSDQEIAWYENLDSNGNFSDPIIVTNLRDSPLDIQIGDIDNDGDLDLFSAHLHGNKIAWYENQDGLGSYGVENVVNRHVHSPFSVFSADLDNDGDQDIISASQDDNKIAWYENLDGNGSYSQIKVISTEVFHPTDMHIGDIDGDNDIDIIVSGLGFNESSIVWFENLDSEGNFGTAIPIFAENLDFTIDGVYLKDIDGDFDIDIVATTNQSSTVIWLENLDGLGNFGVPFEISGFPNDPQGIIASDIDGDGDNDVIVAATFNDAINWFENLDGLGSFGPRQIINGPADGIIEVFASDLDGDGDMDLLSASRNDHKIAWYENEDGLGNFGPQQVISNEAFSAQYVYTEDIDNDGDLDVLSASSQADEIAWYINLDGLGTFSSERIIIDDFEGANSVFASDIDGDGDIDVVGCAEEEDVIAWYENLGLLQNQISGFANFNINSQCDDPSNFPASNIMVMTDNGENTFATFSQDDGSYILNTNEGEFTTTISISSSNFFDVLPEFHTSVFDGLNNSDEANFCIAPNQAINDVNIIIYPLDDARPGFDASYEIIYTNSGTLFSSGTIELNYNNEKMTFLSVDTDIDTQTENSITFNYTNLQPLDSGHIILDFNVFPPPTTEIDDILNFEVSITSDDEVDETPEDNIYILDQTVIGSFDPNDILVLEGPEIPIEAVDDYLHYIIRFQNTGTAPAIFVRVTNQLDANLDWTTMQLESLSHPGVVNITNGNEVEFFFEGINLPAEIDDPEGSNGYIAYRIKPVESLDIGDTIFNDAAIFFDFNPPIITNTVSTTVLDESLSLTDNELILSTRLFPNPSESTIMIDSEIILSKIEIYNTIGATVLRKTNPKGIDSVNIEELTSGIYFVKLSNKDETGSIIRKIVKQ